MKILRSLLFIVCICLLGMNAKAQLVNGCGFLQQNRLEIGIANNGAYGTPENAPAGYHSNNSPLIFDTYNPATGVFIQHTTALGFVADYDSNGWTVGTPPYFGDYFIPGSPQEGWSVEVNGVRCDAFSNNYTVNLATGFVGGSLTGTNQSVVTLAGVTTSKWLGTFGNLAIKQTTTVKTNKLYFTANVKFYNTGGTTLQNVYYMRTLDPDNDVSTTGNFTTINDITYQLPSPGNKSLVGCTSTTDTNAYLGLGTIDCRSKVFICNFNLFPPLDTLGYLFSGTHPDLTYSGTLTQDVGVGIVYQLGDIAAGDSTQLNFAYILDEAALDEALEEIKPNWLNNSNLYQSNDTIFACANTNVPVSIVNGNDFSWSWSSSAPLSGSTGLSNLVTFGTTPVLVTAIGTGICLDTITFFLAPATHIYTTINAGICSGSAYVYNGVAYTVAGTYMDTVTTPSGCDSIVTLNLTVGANTTHMIALSLCQGATYLFNGNVLSTAGVYYDTLVNSVGCDSLITLNLSVGTTTYGSYNMAICQGTSYLFNAAYLSVPGVYEDTITNVSGCDSMLTLNLSLKPVPVADLISDKSQICSSDSVLITYTGSLNPANIYTFNPDGGIILSGSGIGPYRVKWNTSGIKNPGYLVTLDGCPSIPATKPVNVIDGPHVKAIYDSSICIDATADISANVDVAGTIFTWNLGSANLISGNTATAGPLTLSWNTVGTKMVIVQSDNLGCLSNIDTAFIAVHELPTATISSLDGKDTYCETDVVHLTTDIISNAFYQWTPLELFTRYDYNNADLMIYDTTLVTTKVTTAFGCIATDSMTIYTLPCDDFFIPNSFTPNGDNNNDIFRVLGLKTNALVEMMIYDRWGKQVFQSSDVNLGWNGFYKGKKAESGVYFYHIKITFPTGIAKILKGDITLFR